MCQRGFIDRIQAFNFVSEGPHMSYTVTVNNIDVRSTHETHFNDGKKVNRLEIINTRIKGLGFFDSPFVKSNRKIGDLFKNGVRLADVTFCLSTKSEEVEVYNLTIHIFNNEYGDKFPKIQISIFCDESLFETIRQYTRKDDAIRVQFDILEWLNEGDDTRDFETAKAKISVVETLVLGYSTKTKIDYEIEDIKDYLNRTNCAGNSVGQVADICNEFAESFRNAPASVSKNDLVGEIESLISFLRFVLQKHLNDGTAPILIRYENDDRFIFDSNAEKFNEEIEKLTNKKEKYKAIAIYNNLWTTRNAEEIFRNGLPVSSDSAQSLADNYLNLKYVYSKTCEKILLDLLIICDIFVYTSSAQFLLRISINAPATGGMIESSLFVKYSNAFSDRTSTSFSKGTVFNIF